VDTGSPSTAVPCLGCHHCGAADVYNVSDPHFDKHHRHVDPLFYTNASSTFSYVECEDQVDRIVGCYYGKCDAESRRSDHFEYTDPPNYQGKGLCRKSMSYAEGSSWRAVEVADYVYSGGYHQGAIRNDKKATLIWNCQLRLQGMFETQLADGIMGMINGREPESYWQQLRQQNVIKNSQFSLCFVRMQYSYQGTVAGAMVLGGTDSRLHDTPMEYAQLEDRTGGYRVTLLEMELRLRGGTSVVEEGTSAVHQPLGKDPEWATGKGTMMLVDSGSTNSYLPSKYKQAFRDAFKGMTGLVYSKHKQYTFDQDFNIDSQLPTVVIYLKSVHGEPIKAVIPPSHYFRYDPSTEKYLAKLYFRVGTGTLGASFLRGKDVLFDWDNKHLGIAESSCNYREMGYKHFDPILGAFEEDETVFLTANSVLSICVFFLVCSLTGILVRRGHPGFSKEVEFARNEEEEMGLFVNNDDDEEGTELVVREVS